MTDTNSTTLRNSLSAAVKSYVKANGWTNKDAAEKGDVVYGRMCNILSGKIEHISVDALVNVLGAYGYQLTVNSSDNSVEIVLILDSAGKVLPEIERPESLTTEDRKVIDFTCPVEIIDPAQNNADFDPDFDRVSTDE